MAARADELTRAQIYHRVCGAMDACVPDDGEMTGRERRVWALLNGLATELRNDLERDRKERD